MSHISVVWHCIAHLVLDVSSLSLTDFALIAGHYNSLLSDKTESDDSLLARGYTPEAIASMRKRQSKKFSPITSVGLRFLKPVSEFQYGQMHFVLDAFDNYERGVMPYPGSFSEQPAQIIEIFGLIRALRREQEEKLRKRNEANVRQHKDKRRASR